MQPLNTVSSLKKFVKQRRALGLSPFEPLGLNWYSRSKSILHRTESPLVGKIDSIRLNIGATPLQAIFHLVEGIRSVPLCSGCNDEPCVFTNKGYTQFCSHKCARTHPDVVAKVESTMESRYGVRNASHSRKLLNKKRRLHLEKYGVEYPWQREEVRKKSETTMLSQFGVSNASFSDELKAVAVKTWMKKYGVDHPMKSQTVKEKCKKTNRRRRGVDWPTQDPEVQKKVSKTNLERIGVTRPAKDPLLLAKIFSNRKNTRKYISCGGKTFHGLQGYEPQAIKYLIEELGYSEESIVAHPKTTFVWRSSSGKEHHYHPDIKIKGKKHFIEVKSRWTIKGSQRVYEDNLRKRDAVLSAGYRFSFLVLDTGREPVMKTFYP
jgi:hypothetical protein